MGLLATDYISTGKRGYAEYDCKFLLENEPPETTPTHLINLFINLGVLTWICNILFDKQNLSVLIVNDLYNKQIISTTFTRKHTKFISSLMVDMLVLSVEDCVFDPPSSQDTKIGICCCGCSSLCDQVC